MAKLPESIGKYKIISLVAKGGMGEVYKAMHPTLKRYVILKKLTIRGGGRFIERFRREARIMMDFQNEHIVNVYDHFKEGSSYYIVLEFVDGLSLDKLIERDAPLPDDVALWIFLDCCRALQYAHDRKVIHRDIKPANILLSKKGEVKLVDFGIAAMAGEDEEGLTREGTTLGTPSYMAPEQFEDSKSVDNRADIYSMGVMLYEMVTGSKPFPGTFTPDAIAQIQKGKYQSARKRNRKVSLFVNRIIKRCMRVKPKRRYQDLKGISKKIIAFLRTSNARYVKQRLISYIRQEPIEALPRRPSPTLKIVLAMGFLLLLLLGVSGYLMYQRGYHYEYLWPRKYGAFSITATVKKGNKAPEETFVKATLFLDDGLAIPKVENVKIRFRENRERETEESFVLESARVYAPAGAYRLKVCLENQLYWYTFFLDPRSVQRQTTATENSRVFQLVLDEGPPLPLEIQYHVTDQATGEDLTDRTQLFIMRESQWFKWNQQISDSLTTNRRYQLKFGKLGYLPRIYDLYMEADQTFLSMMVSLMPEPATVRIVSNFEGLKLKLNGSSTYLSGDEENSFKKLAPTSKDAQVLELGPGEYELEVSHSRGLSKSVTLELESRARREVRIDFDAEQKSLQVRVLR